MTHARNTGHKRPRKRSHRIYGELDREPVMLKKHTWGWGAEPTGPLVHRGGLLARPGRNCKHAHTEELFLSVQGSMLL